MVELELIEKFEQGRSFAANPWPEAVCSSTIAAFYCVP
ncbi:hypothetical protein C8J35_11430 [Rhizobium sp. PP-F2F-G38]|nr:hypothetical protein C8J37_11526 [Rhizobium sp. PP-WC-1G-195]PYE39113.1 hypothetical protein DFI02_1323 [Rhizobium sp. PP-F2F-G20b]PYE93308.1 hypothetical protein C8J35_11430 [Rhizobium sp. PP-F2F-G38]TCL89417.1 hypothetical protein C8J38_11332 [Rhizobium sp. PP-WC-2G-219]TCP75340.1 hypothetical protein C8J31_13317 [Rhizobium sp. PP-CC-2G-626]TCQ17218.1 hypothetical protein C8J33_11315 [Rhizobium sp. PP-CC-3G-465]